LRSNRPAVWRLFGQPLRIDDGDSSVLRDVGGKAQDAGFEHQFVMRSLPSWSVEQRRRGSVGSESAIRGPEGVRSSAAAMRSSMVCALATMSFTAVAPQLPRRGNPGADRGRATPARSPDHQERSPPIYFPTFPPGFHTGGSDCHPAPGSACCKCAARNVCKCSGVKPHARVTANGRASRGTLCVILRASVMVTVRLP